MDKKRVKAKRRKDEYTGPGGVEEVLEKPPNEEYSVAKWLRRNVPTKKTKCLNHNVEYFTASKALDALLESKFSKGSAPLLPSREVAIELLDSMLVHKFFHRAKKLPVTDEELRGRKKGDDKAKKSVDKESKAPKEAGTDAESSHVESTKPERVDKEKKKRKIRLDMHPEQVFVDGSEAYVWIYDPIPLHYWLFGALMVVFVIVMCLFPLWPTPLRLSVYYLSIAAAGFLVFILGLAVLRFIVFCVVWVATGSKHHFWLFPNLTEDVGFLASFWPLYKHEYKGTEEKCKKCKKQHKEKDSDAEDETCPLVKTKKTPGKSEKEESDDTPAQAAAETEETSQTKSTGDHKGEEDETRKSSLTPSESESESSQRSSTGKDFEIVDSTDLSPE